MKTIQQIKNKIKEIETDERMKAKTATIDINAPLALIQCGLEHQLTILKWVLKCDRVPSPHTARMTILSNE